MTLFPSFSILGIRRKEDLQQLHVRSIGYIFLSARPIVLILVMVKDNILVQTLSIVGVALSADLYILIDVGLLFIILSKIIHLSYFSLIENSLWRSIGTLLTPVMLLWGGIAYKYVRCTSWFYCHSSSVFQSSYMALCAGRDGQKSYYLSDRSNSSA